MGAPNGSEGKDKEGDPDWRKECSLEEEPDIQPKTKVNRAEEVGWELQRLPLLVG